MFERTRALDVIESAMDTDPYCPACHAPTDVVDDGGRLYLRCTALNEPQSLLARIGAVILPHLDHEILDLREGIAA